MAVGRSDRNTSAANLISLNEGFRQAWVRLLDAAGDEDRRESEFAELANLLEIASMILADKAIHGRSKKVLDEMLDDALALIIKDPDTLRRLKDLTTRPETFEFLQAELKKRRTTISLMEV